MSLSFLETIGLTKKEADLYELLLQLGETPANEIIKQLKLKRATAYKTLYSLEKKGLVTKKDIGNIINFRPEAPTKLLSLAEKQYDQLERAKDDLTRVLPELNSSYIISVEKPVVQTFEGVKGIQEVFKDIYAKKDEPVYGCVDLEIADKALPEYVTKQLIPIRIKNKLEAKSFIADSNQAKKVAKKDAEQLRQSVLLDKKDYPLPAEIDVYDDKVAMLSFANGQFAGILVQNKDIATSLKSIFKLAFEKKPSEPSPVQE